MLGGGTFVAQNKILPGAYINFVSLARANATISDRGYVAFPMELDWGVENEVFAVENDEFQTESVRFFAHSYIDDEMKGLRDLFLHAKTLYVYRLNAGGAKATCKWGDAKYSGTRGNDLKVVVTTNVDDDSKFDVETFLGIDLVDEQTVATMAELEDNYFVDWKKSATLEADAGTSFSGGTNGTVTGAQHQKALDLLEGYSFNVIGCISNEPVIKSLYAAYTKRMRDEVGVKFQLVAYDCAKDYEGVINLMTKTLDNPEKPQEGVWWLAGAEAGCVINKDLTNNTYDGEFTLDTSLTQTGLTNAIKAGQFVFHKVGNTVRVLDDINSFVTVYVDKNEDFCSNQVIRVIDNWGNDVAAIFNNRYLGLVQNDKIGRTAFWNDVCYYARQLQDLRALQDFSDDDITVVQGKGKNDVYVTATINIVGIMKRLYMVVQLA